MIEDLILVQKIRGGDVAAFETLFRKFYSPLLLYSTGITGSSKISEDIIQELFYSIWKNRESLEIIISVRTYLYKSVRNNSLTLLQRNLERHNPIDASLHSINTNTQDPCHRDTSISSMPQRRAEIYTSPLYLHNT